MIDIARAYYDHRAAVAGDAAILRRLIEVVDAPNDLSSPQWAQWYSVALSYEPDLVLELGRGRGNSTALFAQAASRLRRTKVVSLCRTADWMSLVAPRIAQFVPPDWFSRIDAQLTDILSVDYDELLAGYQRVLLAWDAHGFEIAETVLGEIVPKLVGREHLILMHDILDNRYDADARQSYEGQPLWKGAAWQERTGTWGASVNIGWMHSIQDQVIAIADFSARNGLEIGSADHELARFFASQPEYADDMRRTIGEQFFSSVAKWAFWSLNGTPGPIHFPTPASRQMFAHRSSLPLHPPQSLPITVTTEARAWQYAAAFDWKPSPEVPAESHAWLRLRLTVDGGAIGVGLVAENGRDFSVRRAVAARPRASTVVLPIENVSRPEQLIVQTWAMPVASRVRIEELTLLW